MKMEELAARWIAETERVEELVRHDFMLLDDNQLDYRVHVNHCSIRQIMHRVLSANSRLFTLIERAIPVVRSAPVQDDYRPGYVANYFLNRMAFSRCKAEKATDRNADLEELTPGSLFSKLMDQQNRIKELVTLCRSVDMNQRVVPFRWHGLIKLSLAETIEYLVLYQKNRFRMARHIGMLQGGGAWGAWRQENGKRRTEKGKSGQEPQASS